MKNTNCCCFFFPFLAALAALYLPCLGTPGPTKTDEFSEKFETAFDPPLIFGKSYCGFRDKIATKVHMFIMADCCVVYDPISHEMRVVQQFNLVIG